MSTAAPILGTTWWEERPRGMVAAGIRKAAEQIQTPQEAPPGMEHYQEHPVDFMVAELGIRRETLVWSSNEGYRDHRWDGTPDPIVTWLQALVDWQDVGVEAATGTQKSFTLALTKLWFLATWQGARAYDYAAVKEQLTEYSWTELGKLWPKFKVLFPSADLLTLRIRMDGRVKEGDAVGWGALGRGVRVGADEEIAAGAAGMHGAHMLISVEEAQGFQHAAARALENTNTAPHNLLQYVGNPDSNDDPLHQFCILPTTQAIRISALDHPNVVVNNARDPGGDDLKGDVMIVPGAVSRSSIARRLAKYGPEHRYYRSRVRGISPTEHHEALIRQSWIDRAVERWRTGKKRTGFWSLGIDVARSEDGDKAAIAEGVGPHLDRVDSFQCDNPVRLGVQVAAKMAMLEIHEKHAGVDTGGGYGGGTADKLKELDYYIVEFNGGEKPLVRVNETLLEAAETEQEKQEIRKRAVREANLFRNRRAQAHWRLAQDLQHDRIGLPPDEELHEELRSLRWKNQLGKVQVEEKDEIAERLGRSPDKADAVVIWNEVRERFWDEEDVELRAWDPEALEAEYEHRRIKDLPAIETGGINPILVERIE